MKRREFLKTTAATSALATLGGASLSVSAHSGTNETQDVACCDRTHATVQDAMCLAHPARLQISLVHYMADLQSESGI